MTLPLEGIKVLDLAYYLPATYCTQLMGDFGAERIKIEEPVGPGPRRPGVGQSPLKTEVGEKYAAYNSYNRNTRSIVLNLKSKEGLKVFHKLAEKVDVLVENMRPGVPKRLGIDYETIKQINPRIIYCSITGYGQYSPYLLVAGHDPCYCSIAGAQGCNVDRKGEPVNFGIPLADIGSSLHATIGVLLALRARDITSKGQFIDLSMTDSVFSFVSKDLREWLCPGIWPLVGQVDVAMCPLETKDGKYFVTSNAEEYFWERFCRAVGREDYIPYHYARGGKAKEISATVRQIIKTKTRDEWVKILREADTCVAPILSPEEVKSDPHILQRQLIIDLDHPTLGKVKQIGFPIKLSDTAAQFRSFAPFVGQHTAEVLMELGYTNKQIKELEQKGAVQMAETIAGIGERAGRAGVPL